MPRGFGQRSRGKVVELDLARPFGRREIIVQPEFGGHGIGTRGRGRSVNGGELQMVAVEIEQALIVERPAFAGSRHQIPAVHIADIEVAGDSDFRQRPGKLGVGQHESVDTDVAAVEEARDLGDGSTIQMDAHIELVFAIGGGLQQAAGRKRAEAGGRLVGAGRRTGKTNHDVAVLVGINVDVGVADIEDGFGIAELEIDTATADLNIGNGAAAHGAGLRAVIEQRLNIPWPGGHADNIHARCVEPETGKRELSGEQAGPADARLHGLDVGERLNAGGRIVVDQNVVDGEAGAGEKIQVHRANVHGSIERGFEGRLDARAETVGAEERRGQSEGDHEEHDKEKRTAEKLHCCRANRSA